MLIFSFTSGKIYLWGATENGKRFAFCQSEYILRTSSMLEVIPMENKAKGTRHDVGNNSRY